VRGPFEWFENKWFELRTSGAEVFHFAELSSYKGVSEGRVYMKLTFVVGLLL